MNNNPHSPGISEEIRKKKLADIRSKSELGRVVHVQANTVHDLMADIRFLFSELERITKEREKLIDEVRFQVERNDKQRATYFKLESQLVDKDKVIADLKYMLETEQEDAFPIEDCLAIINRYKEADTSET
jgi:predicted RNase H-like nuclease (RuvC/YqgF family)